VTGCKAHVRWVTKTRVGLPNQAMTDLTWKNLQAVGAPAYTEEALEFGRQIQRHLGVDPMPDPFIASVSKLTPPEENEREAARRAARLAEAPQRRRLCRVLLACADGAPARRPSTAAPALAGLRLSELGLQRAGGLPAAMDPGLFVAAKTMALTLVDLASLPGALEAAQAEFRDRTGGGVGGTDWVGPLLPADFVPPVDLRWPEYVTTARGREWCIPTPIQGTGAGEPL
jgi:aminobenzoyl-glutamate utilization protein B